MNKLKKLVIKFLLDLMLTNEIKSIAISKSHQVIGSKVVKIFKFESIFCLTDKIETKFPMDKIGVNFANSVLSGVITQL